MGGAERHLANLLGPLGELGVHNEVAQLWSGHAYDDSVLPFARVHDFGLPLRKVWPAVPRLVRLARGVDLVHTQLPWADIAGRIAAIAARRPSVTTLQSTWYDRGNVDGFERPLRRSVQWVRRIDALTARSTRRFFAVSEATRRTYVRELGLPAARVEVIPNSVDLERFDPQAAGTREAARAALGCAEGELAVLMVARLVTPKGHAHAISAAAALRHELPLTLYVAGTGPEQERLRPLAEATHAPVVFLGARTDVPRLLRAADLFLFPSLIEGMPLALIEAMAMGVPCLCSDIAENREAGGDAVGYFAVGDIPALTEKLRGLLRDGEARRTLGAAARSRAALYSSRTVARTLFASMQDVLAREAEGHVVAV